MDHFLSAALIPLDQIAKTTGITVTTHDLRRTFISVGEACSVPLFALQAVVNHRRPGSVTGGYWIPDDDELPNAMQTITDKLKELIGICQN